MTAKCLSRAILFSLAILRPRSRMPRPRSPAHSPPVLTDGRALAGRGRARPVVKDRVAAVKKRIAAESDDLEALYKHLHTNPELSLHEVNTAARMAKELKKLGFEVTEKVGGTGVVGVFKNGNGPTVLVRTDMDALPVAEAPTCPTPARCKVRDKNDNEVGVMHACGHDMHMTCWTARRGCWSR